MSLCVHVGIQLGWVFVNGPKGIVWMESMRISFSPGCRSLWSCHFRR